MTVQKLNVQNCKRNRFNSSSSVSQCFTLLILYSMATEFIQCYLMHFDVTMNTSNCFKPIKKASVVSFIDKIYVYNKMN